MIKWYLFLSIQIFFIITCLLELFDAKEESQIKLGRSINIFIRFGYLSISMNVISFNDSTSWIFKEPTRKIMKDTVSLRDDLKLKNNGVFQGDFHMEFCDNKQQLFQAYFRDFYIEPLDQSWKAFTNGWHTEVAAKKLGIQTSFLSDEYSYVLIRVSKFLDVARFIPVIPANQLLEDQYQHLLSNITFDSTSSAIQFMNKIGTHYIHGYTTGNAIYQVFVFSKVKYRHLKEKLKRGGTQGLSNVDLHNYFAPWYSEHIGRIRCASGNNTVEQWASSKLRLSYYLFTYVSLLKLQRNRSLLRGLDAILHNEALLQLDLRSVHVLLKDPVQRSNFLEILNNYLKLWETNI